MNGQPPVGGLDLGAHRIPIRESRLIALCHLEVREGGLSEPGAVMHIRAVDIPRAEAWLIPIDPGFARKLAERLAELVGTHE